MGDTHLAARIRVALGALALVSFLLTPALTHAAFWPGFPFAPVPEGTRVVLPEPASIDLCATKKQVAGLTLYVPKPCDKIVPPPPPTTATLKLQKTVVNDDGGTRAAADFQGKIDGANVVWNAAVTLTPGAHTASEVALPGYIAGAWGGDCAANGSITLAAGDNKTCTVTNDDQPGTLRVVKVVVNDNGGTKTAADFSFQVNGTSTTAFESDGQNELTVDAGTYSIVEVTATGYATTYNNCSNVAIANGASATCTITNNDIAPGPTTGTLVVDKVTNPSGSVIEFSITASGTGTITGGGAGTVTDAASKSYEVTPGTYSVSESVTAGWEVASNTCVGVAIAAGETKTCTITNTKLPRLTVIKTVVNDNGGTKEVADFALFLDGHAVTSGVATTTAVGAHTVSETSDSGYAATIGGDCAANGSITLAAGDVKSCTIVNNDVAPAQPTLSFSANPTTVHEGSVSDATTTLTWDSANATICVASVGWNGARSADGSEVVTPTASTNYVLDCTGPGGSVQATTTVTFVPTPQPGGRLLITEALYDLGEGQGLESGNEWVELYNGTDSDINLGDYFVRDAASFDALPAMTLPAGKFALITGSSTTATLWSIPADTVFVLLANQTIGNGLGNSGDVVMLQNSASTTIDAVSWGNNTTAFTPSVGDVDAGSSISRIDKEVDTATDWQSNSAPSPGKDDDPQGS